MSSKNFLNGLDIPAFTAVNPAARLWLDTVANVRRHGETQRKPSDRFTQERLSCGRCRPSPTTAPSPFGPANACCRVALETNLYSVPHRYASPKLTLKLYAERLRVFDHER